MQERRYMHVWQISYSRTSDKEHFQIFTVLAYLTSEEGIKDMQNGWSQSVLYSDVPLHMCSCQLTP